MDETEQKWNKLAAQHEASMSRYVELAESLTDEQWRAPYAEGKWTPIEITEHLRAAYQIIIDELNGGQGMRLKTKAWMRPFIKLFFLPRIIRSRQMPKNIKAPREIRPTNCVEDRSEALAKFREFGERAQKEIGDRRNDPNAYATHYLMGKIRPLEGMEFVTIHLEHHTRQLPNS